MKLTKSGQKKKAWKACSLYSRQKDADEDGYVVCCTCTRINHWKDMDAGHFIPKSRGNAVYFQENNIHAQCKGCNISEGGRFEDYYPYMVNRYGQDTVDELVRLSKTIVKLTMQDLKDIECYYKQRLEEL